MASTKAIKITVNVPQLTAEEWELYSASMNCTRAARALNAALVLACKSIAKVRAEVTGAVWSTTQGLVLDHAMRDFMYPVMSKYAGFGASDSEPLYHAKYTLRTFSNSIL